VFIRTCKHLTFPMCLFSACKHAISSYRTGGGFAYKRTVNYHVTKTKIVTYLNE